MDNHLAQVVSARQLSAIPPGIKPSSCIYPYHKLNGYHLACDVIKLLPTWKPCDIKIKLAGLLRLAVSSLCQNKSLTPQPCAVSAEPFFSPNYPHHGLTPCIYPTLFSLCNRTWVGKMTMAAKSTETECKADRFHYLGLQVKHPSDVMLNSPVSSSAIYCHSRFLTQIVQHPRKQRLPKREKTG